MHLSKLRILVILWPWDEGHEIPILNSHSIQNYFDQYIPLVRKVFVLNEFLSVHPSNLVEIRHSSLIPITHKMLKVFKRKSDGIILAVRNGNRYYKSRDFCARSLGLCLASW